MEGMFSRKREAGSDLEEVSNPSKRVCLGQAQGWLEGEEMEVEEQGCLPDVRWGVDVDEDVSEGEGRLDDDCLGVCLSDDGMRGDLEDSDGEDDSSVYWGDVYVLALPRRPPPLEPGSDSGDDEVHRGLPPLEPGPDSGVEEVFVPQA